MVTIGCDCRSFREKRNTRAGGCSQNFSDLGWHHMRVYPGHFFIGVVPVKKFLDRIGGRDGAGDMGMDPSKAPLLVPDDITRDYPLFASSLFNLLRNAETRLQ